MTASWRRSDGAAVPLETVINLRAPPVTEIAATAGLDFVWIDLEHSSMRNAEVDGHIVAARSRAIAPFAQVPWNDPARVEPILEMGPAAIRGLVENRTVHIDDRAASGILTQGGTILGTSRDKPHQMPFGGQKMDMTAAAAEELAAGRYNAMIAVRGDSCVPVPLEEVAGQKKMVPPDHPWIRSARLLGTCMGV